MNPALKSASAFVSIRQILLILVVCSLVGCAAVDNSMRMTPSTSISAANISSSTLPPKPSGLPGELVLYSVDEDGTLNQIPDNAAFSAELYVTVDVSNLLREALKAPVEEDVRNRIVEFLIYLSDRNADVWMSRVWALNKFRKSMLGVTRNLATTGAGVTALIIPPVSAGLSAFNLLAGSTSDQIDAVIYSNETIETLFKGISAARRAERNKIKLHLTEKADKYDMFYALDQIRYYDSLVSFRKGLAYLGNLAEDKIKDAQVQEAKASGNTNIIDQAKAAAPGP